MDAIVSQIKQLSSVVQSFLGVNGQMTVPYYKQYWHSFKENPDAVSCYVIVLLSKLIGISTGEDKSTPLADLVLKIVTEGNVSLTPSELAKVSVANEQDQETSQLRQTLFTTLYFVTLFLPFEDTHPQLRLVLNRWTETYITEKANGKSNDFTDEILRMLNPAYLESTDFIINMVEQCSVIDVPPDYIMLGLTGYASGSTNSLTNTTPVANQDLLESKMIVKSLIHSYLTKCLINPSKDTRTKPILETILLFLKHPLLPEARMLTLLYMLKRFSIIAPSVPSSLLAQAINSVKVYYLWPRPYGDFAREVLHALTMEARSPGSVLRSQVFQENPSLAPRGLPLPSHTGKERLVHIITDFNFGEARTLYDLLKPASPPESSTTQLQIDILSNIFHRVLSIEPTLVGLEFCVTETIQSFYDQALEIMEQASAMNEKDAKAYRTQKFSSMREQIISSMLPSAEFEPPQHPRLSPLLYQFSGLKCVNSKPRKGEDYIDNLKFPVRKQAFQILLSIFTPYAKIAVPSPTTHKDRKHVVKIAVVGGDATLHHILSAHVCLRRDQPQLFSNVELRYYFIPACGSGGGNIGVPSIFASFLGRSDRWYCRNIVHGIRPLFCIAPSTSGGVGNGNQEKAAAVPPLSKEKSANSLTKTAVSSSPPTKESPPISPLGSNQQELISSIKSLQLQKQMATSFYRTTDSYEPLSGSENTTTRKSASAGPSVSDTHIPRSPTLSERDSPLSPGGVLRQELDCYFREATWKLRMKIFQCECINAYVKAFAETNDLPSTLTLAEVQQHKAFKFSAPVLSMKYVQMNVLGVARPGQTVEHKPYVSLVISNVGQSSDRIVPNPTRPWLELYALDSDPKKKKMLKDEGQGHCYHASVLEFETEDKKKQFDALLDGELYGPFYRVRISACTLPEDQNEIQDLPVMTYLPLDLV